MKINDLKLNEEARILKVCAKENIKRRLMDIGFIKGALVKPVLTNSSMRAYLIKGSVIGVRWEDTKDIEVVK